eukprot:gnl/TRDRNA2_/TRDRNA2_92201_c0_seq1.p3 gnl/TRDRNA2_/TRDRNA2_92201_c0~~gnl/TRDRNA2_/TRDRNA2_92201_c0_seq1.p3  ORF type:complete len:131 (+),score=37.24 gnl/TRDRNA2_/TRDRNA2_92201_c0_seq1:65-457(+)
MRLATALTVAVLLFAAPGVAPEAAAGEPIDDDDDEVDPEHKEFVENHPHGKKCMQMAKEFKGQFVGKQHLVLVAVKKLSTIMVEKLYGGKTNSAWEGKIERMLDEDKSGGDSMHHLHDFCKMFLDHHDEL